ncbi:hypothetical protein J6590_051251 [Homalodisca vitripennis]|nr:hypothetical protein J6590_051251 [Homalodisca vitripennis]
MTNETEQRSYRAEVDRGEQTTVRGRVIELFMKSLIVLYSYDERTEQRSYRGEVGEELTLLARGLILQYSYEERNRATILQERDRRRALVVNELQIEVSGMWVRWDRGRVGDPDVGQTKLWDIDLPSRDVAVAMTSPRPSYITLFSHQMDRDPQPHRTARRGSGVLPSVLVVRLINDATLLLDKSTICVKVGKSSARAGQPASGRSPTVITSHPATSDHSRGRPLILQAIEILRRRICERSLTLGT